ncbi:MAG: TrmB family transcriptional regulator [Patescibacteria group bacterium]
MYKDIFTQTGLSDKEAVVYEFLLKNGEVPAGDIIKKTPLKRGVVYNILEGLRKKGLVSKRTKNKIAYFSPEHPEKLRQYAEERKSGLQKAERNLEANMDRLASDFNLSTGKPGIRFFEGIEGVQKVLEDSLNAREEIYTYVDVEAVVKHIDKINQEYVKKRDKLNIKKRALLIDTPFARKYLKDYHRQVTEIKFLTHKLHSFHTVMQIYDGKISYITLTSKAKIGVVIEDKNIYQMHKILFEVQWNNAQKIF